MENLGEKLGFRKEWFAGDTRLLYSISLDSIDAKKYLAITINKISV